MASASNRNPQIVLPSEMDGRYYIGNVNALGNQTGLTADHSVEDLALVLVARVGGLD
jgi:hypothetical protein